MASAAAPASEGKKQVRVWIDMCADLFHFGHANALRQAKLMGDVLVVGVHPDEEVEKHKGPPVMTQEERLRVVEACKWVDEVTLEAPYTTTLATLDKFNIDFCVHGEDISTNSEGVDSYQEVKDAGRFQLIKRSVGVSTTDLVGRMLLLTKSHFNKSAEEAAKSLPDELPRAQPKQLERLASAPLSTNTIFLFSDGKSAKPDDKIVYMDGGFDLFHAGHVNALEQARKLGTYLIVGVHSDQEINAMKGENFPIMNLHERVLCVLSCKYVDEVIIGAPMKLTKEWLEQWNISVVAHGDERDAYHPIHPEGVDNYAAAREMGIYHEVRSTSGLTTHAIVERIIEHRLKYQKRNEVREKKNAIIEEQLKQKKEQAAAAAKQQQSG
ncbi:choline phosphate cytidylyltransferase [Balamuthia mandrillaris]